MIKVLHVIPNLLKGGAQRIAIDICKELSKRADFRVMLVYFKGENEFRFLTEGLTIRKIDKINAPLRVSKLHESKCYNFLLTQNRLD
jgi:hypothetical protein